jgi:hypothetical protein
MALKCYRYELKEEYGTVCGARRGKNWMNVTKHLFEGMKLVALFGAIALVVWSMPEAEGPVTGMALGAGEWQPTAVTVRN